MNEITMRTVTGADAALLRCLAARCRPLDVHTPYTYWVVCHFFGDGCFLLEHEGAPVGYIMTVKTDECLFVWQIGLMEQFRGKGLSQQLIQAAAEYAGQRKLDLQVSIAAENAASYASFSSYCREHGLAMEPCGEIALTDLMDPDFKENEIHYKLTRK